MFHHFENSSSSLLLPSNFEPLPYSVTIGRSKRMKESIGNRRLKVLALNVLTQYSTAPKRVIKSRIVSDIVATVRDACPIGAFISWSEQDKRWYEVPDCVAREKVGYTFRELIGDKYKSSSKSKIATRKKSNRKEASANERQQLSPRENDKDCHGVTLPMPFEQQLGNIISPEDARLGGQTLPSNAYFDMKERESVSPRTSDISLDATVALPTKGRQLTSNQYQQAGTGLSDTMMVMIPSRTAAMMEQESMNRKQTPPAKSSSQLFSNDSLLGNQNCANALGNLEESYGDFQNVIWWDTNSILESQLMDTSIVSVP